MWQWAILAVLVLVLIISFVFLVKEPQKLLPATANATTTPQSGGKTTGGTNSKPTTAQPNPTKPGTVIPAPPSYIPQSFTINADDFGATPSSISVPAGTSVTLTIGVDASRTSTGGLEFRSSVINTDVIAPGAYKVVTFTATKSFVLTPYIASTNTPKGYSISVMVK